MRRIATRNALANFGGGILSALTTLFTIPYIVTQLGDVDYGVLTLVTSIVGYFALLDLNFTSGAVKYVAQYRALGRQSELGEVITFGILAYLAIGLAGGILIWLFAGPLAMHAFRLPGDVQTLGIQTLEIAAVGFVFGQLQMYMQSIPQALQRYDVSSAVESVFGVLVPISSVAVLWLGYGLFEVVLLRVCLSIINVLTLAVLVRDLLPGIDLRLPSATIAREVATFSGFAYLSRIAAVTYNQADKLIVGAFAGMASLTYYAVPFTVVGRVFGLTYRLGSVLFPAASDLAARGEMKLLRELYFSATRYLLYINGFVTLLIAVFSMEILTLWIGAEFAEKAHWVLTLSALTALLNSLSNLPSFINDGLGHPKVTGIAAVLRTLWGVLLVVPATYHGGVMGAASAQFVASLTADWAFIAYAHGRTVPFSLGDLLREAFAPVVPGLVVLALLLQFLRPMTMTDIPILVVTSLAAMLFWAVYGYLIVLTREHRRALIAWAMQVART